MFQEYEKAADNPMTVRFLFDHNIYSFWLHFYLNILPFYSADFLILFISGAYEVDISHIYCCEIIS